MVVSRRKEEAQFRLVRKEGGTRVLSVGNLLPTDYRMVRLTVVRSRIPDTVTLRVTKIA